jgi:predicted acetyltransferase
MVVRSIHPEEFNACLDLWDKAFTDTSRDYFKRYFYGDQWFKPEYTRMVEDDGKLVSCVHICKREIRYGISTLTMGGIANVATPQEYRGKGYSSAAMKDSVDIMAADGLDFSMLFTGINEFYERVGFATVEYYTSVAKPKDEIRDLGLPYSVRPYRDTDADCIVNVYNKFNADVILTMVRTADYWTGFATNPESTSYDIWVAEGPVGIVGYLAGRGYGKSYTIAEICCLEGHELSLRALAQEVLKKASEQKIGEFVYRLPDKPAIEAAINEIAIPAEPKPFNYMMLRTLNLRPMFEKMLPELIQRSKNVKGAGQVTIITDYGQITLDIAPGKVVLVDQPAEMSIRLTERMLFDLVFGYQEPYTVLEQAPGRELLAGLFPKQKPVFYMLDGF